MQIMTNDSLSESDVSFTVTIRIAKECPANGSEEDNSRVVEQLGDILSRLPRRHSDCLAVLMLHLNRVASKAHLNNMPPSNLGKWLFQP